MHCGHVMWTDGQLGGADSGCFSTSLVLRFSGGQVTRCTVGQGKCDTAPPPPSLELELLDPDP